MKHILRKVKIIPGKCSPHIIFFLVSAFGKFLELRHNQVVTSFSVPERTHPVIYLFPPVQAENHIIHLPVDKFLNFVI